METDSIDLHVSSTTSTPTSTTSTVVTGYNKKTKTKVHKHAQELLEDSESIISSHTQSSKVSKTETISQKKKRLKRRKYKNDLPPEIFEYHNDHNKGNLFSFLCL